MAAPNITVPIERKPYPEGAGGGRLTLAVMAKFIRDDGDSVAIKSIAGNVLRQAGFPRGAKQRAQALLDYVRRNIGYVEDQALREWIQSARISLCAEGAPACIPIGDCDDLTVACGALMRSAGLDVRILAQDYGPGIQPHVLLIFQTDDGSWLAADPSTSSPIGRRPNAVKEQIVDPLDPSTVPTDAPGGEFIGVGKPLMFGAVDPYEKAAADLVSEVQTPIIQAGDKYLAAGEWDSAVDAYRAAGNAGATSVGPEIDLAGAPGATQPLTHQAWVANGFLAGVSSSSSNGTAATQPDALRAQDLAKQMLALYGQAIAAGRAAQPEGPAPGAGEPKAWGAAAVIGTILAVAMTAGVGYAAWRHYRQPVRAGEIRRRRR